MADRSPSPARLKLVASDRPLQLFLTFRLSRLNSTLNRQAAAVLKMASGLKLPEWRVLSLLATHGELNAARIGEITGVDRGLLSRTFRALELRGLIATARSQTDRREVLVTLTATGRKVHARTLPFMQQRQQMLLDALEPDEQQMAFTIIDKLLIAAGRRDFGGDSGETRKHAGDPV